MVSVLSGAKKQDKPKKPTLTPDNLRSVDKVEVILGICEGPIVGPSDGERSIFIGDTPLQNQAGTSNFPGFEAEFFPGDPVPEPVVPKLGGRAQSTSVNVQLAWNEFVTRQGVATQIDYLEVRILIDRLFVQNTKGTFNHTVEFDIQYKPSSSTVWQQFYDGPIKLTGKTTSRYAKEFRKRVPRINEPYDIRIIKLTLPNDTEHFADITWESFQEITTGGREYPNTAILRLFGQATDQFTGLPEFKGVYKGRICRVPSNYDPETRTYFGPWDGTFKLAWTNNPAWILYDFVMNETYGINSYYKVTLDKYDVYEAGVWCDQPVPDGKGGTQPRYTFNAYITEPRSGKEMARYIAGTFNAILVDNLNGTASLLVDKDDEAVALFTPENISAEGFQYGYTALDTRYNDITVSFRNPDLAWAIDRRRVYNQEDIDENGRIPLDFAAVGCTNAQEAIRRAQYKLITGLTETETCTFQTNRRGQFVREFDIILIADPDMGYSLTGRFKSISQDRRTVTLRDPIYLEAGITYTIQVQLPGELWETTITSLSNGETFSLELADPLPANTPDRAVFSLGGGTEYGLPKPYRVMKVEEVDGNPDLYTIHCLEINRNKWHDADNIDFSDEIEYADRRTTLIPEPPGVVSAEKVIVADAMGLRIDVELSWERSPDSLLRRYRVAYSRNDGPWQIIGETVSTEFTIRDVPHGDYTFAVSAVNLAGYSSVPSVTTLTIGDTAPIELARVTGLEIADQGNDTIFETRDVKFTWRTNSILGSYELGDEEYGGDSGWLDPTFKDFQVSIYDPETDELVFRDYTTNPHFIYTYELNRLHGGPLRKFRVEVAIRDKYNRFSRPAKLLVENPPPPLPTAVSLKAAFTSVFLSYTPPDTSDWAGILVWASTTSGFEPSDETLVYDGVNTMVTLADLTPGETYYIRYAVYDVFGKTGLNISSELSVEVQGIVSDDLQDAIITTEKLADLAVDATKLANLAVEASKLADSAVTAEKIANAAVGSAAIAQAAIGTAHIANGAIINAHIQDATITSAKIHSLVADKITGGTINASRIDIGGDRFQILGDQQRIEIKDAQSTPVTRVRLGRLGSGNADYGIQIYDKDGRLILGAGGFGNGVIPSSAIGDLSLDDFDNVGAFAFLDKIDANNISTYIAAAAIGSAQIGNAAIGAAHISDAAITSAKIGNGQITSAKIQNGAITTAKIGNLAVDTAHIRDLAVDTIKVRDGAITKSTAVVRADNGTAISEDAAAPSTFAQVGATWDGNQIYITATAELYGSVGERPAGGDGATISWRTDVWIRLRGSVSGVLTNWIHVTDGGRASCSIQAVVIRSGFETFYLDAYCRPTRFEGGGAMYRNSIMCMELKK